MQLLLTTQVHWCVNLLVLSLAHLTQVYAYFMSPLETTIVDYLEILKEILIPRFVSVDTIQYFHLSLDVKPVHSCCLE